MLLGGDELGRTQHGNNNAYCQDNTITWFDWACADKQLIGFTKDLITLRRTHPVFRRRRFLAGVEATELRWYNPAGTEMMPAQWDDFDARSVAIYLDGADDPDRAPDGSLLTDEDFLLLINAWWGPLDFIVPATRTDQTWDLEIDTYDPSRATTPSKLTAGEHITVQPRSIVVLHGNPEGSQKVEAE
jgi:isoamylase